MKPSWFSSSTDSFPFLVESLSLKTHRKSSLNVFLYIISCYVSSTKKGVNATDPNGNAIATI